MTVNADITIFNRVMGEDRREVFLPTVISGVSWYDVNTLQVAGRTGDIARDRQAKFIVRIPLTAVVQGKRSYIPEAGFKRLVKDSLDAHWTIQLNACIVKGQYPEAATAGEIEALKQTAENFGTIIEYADNTVRGTDAVKHWRIGGA